MASNEAALDVINVPAAVSKVERLLTLLDSMTLDDLVEMDRAIARMETSLQQLKQARRLAGTILGEVPPKKTREKSPEPILTNGTDKATIQPSAVVEDVKDLSEEKMLALRKKAVIFMSRLGRSVRSYDIIAECGVSPRHINPLLNHAWFSQSKAGIHITPKARQDVLES